MTLTRWSPVRDLAAVEVDALNRMFEAAWGGPLTRTQWVPAVDIVETPEHGVVVKMDLPDVKKEDIKVTFENSVLTIEGKREIVTNVDADDRFRHIERAHGQFRRSFTLPATVDANRVDASYADGVLTVKLPQREEAKPKAITIS